MAHFSHFLDSRTHIRGLSPMRSGHPNLYPLDSRPPEFLTLRSTPHEPDALQHPKLKTCKTKARRRPGFKARLCHLPAV